MRKIYTLLLLFLIAASAGRGQIVINPMFDATSAGALLLAQELCGVGVTVSNAIWVGTCFQSTSASDASAGSQGNRGYFYNGTSSLGIANGIVISSGNVADVPTNNSGSNTMNFNTGGDADLTTSLGVQTYDAIGFQFEFVPEGNIASFRYVWGSDEYDEYVGSAFNDGFAFYLTSLEADGYNYNKENIATIPGTATVVSINNVNKTTNNTYFEMSPSAAIEPDGYTKVLTASVAVMPCKRYRLKLILGDAFDHVYDSWVFFEKNSLVSPTVEDFDCLYSPTAAGSNAVEGCNVGTARINLSCPAGPGGCKVKFSLAGTATYITDYTISPTPVWDGSKWYVTVLEGMTYRDILVTALYDGAAEPDETISITIDLKSCSSETITRNLTIKNRDAITANVTNSDPDYACYTGGVTLNAAGAGGWLNDGSYTYAWSPSAGLSATDIFNPTANPAISTIYSVTITDVCSNSVTTTQQIIPYHDAGYFGLWYGDISSDWDNCRNWGKGKIPDQTVNVIIPASGVTYWPTKTGNIIIGGTAGDNAKSITLQSTAAGAAQFTITGNLTIRSGSAYTLTCGSNATNKNQIFVSGNWSEGTLGGFVKGTSTVTFNGSATQQINNGLTRTYSFWNLIIDGTDAAFYYSGAQVSPGYRVNANDIIINSGKTMRTVRNN